MATKSASVPTATISNTSKAGDSSSARVGSLRSDAIKSEGNTAAVILAAGQGKRMGSELPKVLHLAYGKSLLSRVLESSKKVIPESQTVVVLGVGRELVVSSLPGFTGTFAHQSEQRGTGHAVKSALPELTGLNPDRVLILYGDVPLITAQTLQALIEKHQKSDATLTILTLETAEPAAYGRMIRNATGEIEKIVEARDCSADQLLIREINSGVMVVEFAFLEPAIKELTTQNAQGEYYLTDIVGRAAQEGQRIASVTISNVFEVQGVNTRAELALIEGAIMNERVRELQSAGVIFDHAASCLVGPEVTIAAGARIGPGCVLAGKTTIAAGVILEGHAYLTDTTVAENSVIKWCSRLDGAVVGRDCNVGPFAHLRPGTVLHEEAKVGNFVETKNATVGKDSKASHLTYLGDATIGDGVNIGAGTITCNYDGVHKHRTTIHDGAFIGSNTSLVAPVEIGARALIGAGSVITKNVEPESLAIGRAKQVSKPNWKRR